MSKPAAAASGTRRTWSGSNNVVDPAGAVKFGLVKDWGAVNATLAALESENKANIISNPRITSSTTLPCQLHAACAGIQHTAHDKIIRQGTVTGKTSRFLLCNARQVLVYSGHPK